MRRVLEGGVGWINGGRSERSKESGDRDFGEDLFELSVAIVGEVVVMGEIGGVRSGDIWSV